MFKKVMLIMAGIFLAVGLLLSASSFIFVGCDSEKLQTEIFETKTIDITEDFQKIEISGLESDIRFIMSEDEKCKVVCKESENVFCNIFVKNGTLTVKRKDVREGLFKIGFDKKMEISVYLPKNRYETVSLHTVSGDIRIPEGFYFDHLSAETTSGNIFVRSTDDRTTLLKSVSGDITVAPSGNETTSDSVRITTTSGDVTIRSVNTKMIDLNTVSGDVSVDSASCDTLDIETTSGEIDFEGLEAYEKITMTTTSGDVEGDILSVKNFKIHTVSGEIRVPSSAGDAPVCEVHTTSGDIEITVKQR